MSKKIIIIFILTFLCLLISIPVSSGELDGRAFTGKNGHLNKDASGDDEIIFNDGKFLSVGCQKWGFGDAVYTSVKMGERTFFTADIYSDKYGRITYTGSVKGNEMTAHYFWFDKGKYEKPEQVKWFKGIQNN